MCSSASAALSWTSDLSCHAFFTEEREPSSDEADNDKTGDYQKKTVTGLKLKLKVPTASGDASSPTKPKKKKKPSKDKDNAEADGEEDGEKKKKKKKKKEKEKRSEAGVEVVEDEETRKKREVEMDFKNAMAVFKPKRANRKKDDEDSTVGWLFGGRGVVSKMRKLTYHRTSNLAFPR